MIPLRDTIPSRRVPVLTWILIASNILVFLWQVFDPGSQKTMLSLALVPARLFPHAHGGSAAHPALAPLVTSMFLHGSWFHLLGNMLFLFIFGDNVEDAFGPLPYLVFYLASGVASAICQALAAPASHTPVVGASGAIAGVLGAYFVLYPHARIVTLIPIFIFFQIVEIPAFFFLLFWFLLQFASGAISLHTADAGGGGVAWWAHVGGFAVGLGVGILFRLVRSARGT